VSGVSTLKVNWQLKGEKQQLVEIAGSEERWQADLILLAMGFLGPENYLSKILGVELDECSNYQAQFGDFQTTIPSVFAAGDCRRGQSLVVWAINEGRGAARAIDKYLRGYSNLPAPGISMGTLAVTE
jgi:glutamate synthase (NADPH/NADH) small chain